MTRNAVTMRDKGLLSMDHL